LSRIHFLKQDWLNEIGTKVALRPVLNNIVQKEYRKQNVISHPRGI